MPDKPSDPIDSIEVFLGAEDASISFRRAKGTTVRRRAHSLSRPEVLTEGDGFDVFVFDNPQRFRGFLDALPIVQRAQDDFGWAFSSKETGGLQAVALRSPYATIQTWTDLRGDRTTAQ
jgi:hypothetical protein